MVSQTHQQLIFELTAETQSRSQVQPPVLAIYRQLFLKGQRRTLLQQGHRVTSKHKPKYISHMAQYFRLLLPSPSSSPTFPCDMASVKHRPLQRFIFFHNPLSNRTLHELSSTESRQLMRILQCHSYFWE